MNISSTEYAVWALSNQSTSDVQNMAKRFYASFADQFDYLFFVNDQNGMPPGAKASGVNYAARNDISGTGQRIFDDAAAYGSAGRLKNAITLTFRTAIEYGPILHEIMHQWGNYLSDIPNGGDPHWGFSSVGGQLGGWQYGTLTNLGGNLYQASGPEGFSTFATNVNHGNSVPYSQLELYLMGLIDASQVTNPIQIAQNAAFASSGPGQFTADSIKTITIDTIIAHEGPRNPSVATSQKSFRGAVIVLTNTSLPQSHLDELDDAVQDFGKPGPDSDDFTYNFWEATGSRATLKLDGLRPTNGSFPGPETVGVFDPGAATWYLRNSLDAGAPDIAPFSYGGVGWAGLVGDWNGDKVDTAGVVDNTGSTTPGAALWYLRNSNTAGAPDYPAFPYGLPGWVPVAGDWGGTGHTGIGVFDPSTGTWYLRNEDSSGYPDAGVFQYGGAGWIPVVGDWDGDGKTTIGVVDPTTMTWYLRNSNSAGAPDISPFQYGGIGWKPVVGDWNGDRITTIGVFDPNGSWYVRNSNSAGDPDVPPFAYGVGSWTPVPGRFFQGGSPLLARRGVVTPAVKVNPLQEAQQTGAIPTALYRRRDAEVDALVATQLTVAQDMAGYRWFVDTTLLQDKEYTVGSPQMALAVGPATERMPLHTAVLHAMGQRADLDCYDGAEQDELMSPWPPTEVRRTDTLDSFFADRSD